VSIVDVPRVLWMYCEYCGCTASTVDVFPKFSLVISFIIVKATNECKWDHIKLMILYHMHRLFKFLCEYWPDGGLLRPKLVANNRIT